MSRPCFIYVMAKVQDDGWSAPVKVGISHNPGARVGSINTASPFRVGIFRQFKIAQRRGAEELERTFHKINADARLNGEWFQMEPDAAVLCLVNGITHVFVEEYKKDLNFLGEWYAYTGAHEFVFLDADKRQWGIGFKGEPLEQ